MRYTDPTAPYIVPGTAPNRSHFRKPLSQRCQYGAHQEQTVIAGVHPGISQGQSTENPDWWSWYGMWAWMGPITKATVLLMAFMLLVAIYNFLEHIRESSASNKAAEATAQILRHGGNLTQVASAIENHRLSSEIVLAGLEAFKRVPDGMSDAQAIELAERAMRCKEALIHLQARCRLVLLDSVAVTASLFGMIATVLAILAAFRGTAEAYWAYLEFLIGSVSHAVVPTAIGLAVTVPAALCQTYVCRGIKKLDAQNAALIQQTIAYLNRQPRVSASENALAVVFQNPKSPHCGNRLLLGATWLWWLYFAGAVIAAGFAN